MPTTNLLSVAPLALDLSRPTYTAEQVLIGILLVVVLYTAVAVGKTRLKWAGLPSDQKRHAKVLAGQRAAKTPRKLRFDIPDITDRIGETRTTIRDAVVASTPSDVEQDRPTLRQVQAEIRAAWSSGLASLTDRWSSLAVRIGGLAILDLFLGAIVIVSLDRWRTAADGTSKLDDPGRLVATARETTVSVLEAGIDLLTLFPQAEMIYALALAYSIQAGDWIYHHPFVTGSLLAIIAVTVAVLDPRVVDVVDDRPLPTRRVGYRTIHWLAGIWIVGVGSASLGRLAGIPRVGDLAGFLLALAVAGYATVRGVRHAVRGLRQTARVARESSVVVVGYLLARRAAVLGGAAVAPIVGVYAAVAVVTGRLLDILLILIGASLEVQLFVLLVVGGAIALAVYRARGSWTDLRLVAGDILTQQALRAVLLRRGMPVAAVVVVFLGAVTGGVHPFTAGVFALTFGLVVRLCYSVLSAARYRASLYESPDRAPPRIVIDCYTLVDDDGTPHYWADINGTAHAHTDPDELVAQVVETTQELATTEDVTPKVATHYATDLVDLGITAVDRDADGPATEKRLITGVRRTVFGSLLNNNARMLEDDLRDELEEYPPDMVEAKLTEWEHKPTRDGQLVRRGDVVSLIR